MEKINIWSQTKIFKHRTIKIIALSSVEPDGGGGGGVHVNWWAGKEHVITIRTPLRPLLSRPLTDLSSARYATLSTVLLLFIPG